jgi:hypothetical protein
MSRPSETDVRVDFALDLVVDFRIEDNRAAHEIRATALEFPSFTLGHHHSGD